MTRRVRGLLTFITACGCAAISTPSFAQADPTFDLDALVAATADAAPGVALARSQVGAGDLLEAVATLERVLLTYPEADDARVMHVGLLCRLDDAEGARAEAARLSRRPIAAASWSQLATDCPGMQRPSSGEMGQ